MTEQPKPPPSVRHEPNRLGAETSPYLLQHAMNPVDWYPWGEEALGRARAEDKPILLSIGYAACHWCHVMERESFEDPATARLMNQHYICIKVDREERPDLDEIYMAATVAMSGGGGWPMTVFLTPETKPFFAGTYFPPVAKYGRPGFPQILARIAEAWKDEREDILQQAQELTRAVVLQSSSTASGEIDANAIDAFVAAMAKSFDAEWGGFGRAPKFPPSASLSLLLRHHARTGDETCLRMVRRTLDAMKDGGIYDHLGGGFARYSTDREWLVPHFEKMLYDNAQLARVYLEAFQVTGDPEYRRVATETLDYVVREMTGAEGGYYCATDADSEGVEGKFFVWTLAEIEELLGEGDAHDFALFYDVSEEGNWEGQTILRTPRPLEEVARELGRDVAALRRHLDDARGKLHAARSLRVPPLLDDKVLVSWNGLMIGAMAFGSRVLGDLRYLESATRAADMIETRLSRSDGGLFRTFRKGKAHLDAYLEDYAYLTDALVDLYEASGETRHLSFAKKLADRLVVDFSADDGSAFCLTARHHEALLVRTRDGADGATPNANAIAARMLVRLGAHLGTSELSDRAAAAIASHGELIQKHPRAFASSLAAVDLMLEPPIEIAIVGSSSHAGTKLMLEGLGRSYLPNAIIALRNPTAPGTTSLDLPLLEGKVSSDLGAPLAYVCRAYSCAAPVADWPSLARTLRDATKASRAARRDRIDAP